MKISLQNISFGYSKNQKIFENFNMTLPENAITSILGTSGSGKTTLLRLIAGLEAPQKGQIFLANNLVSKDNKILIPPEKRKIGYIFQDLALWSHLSVFQNVSLSLKAKKVKNYKEKTLQILDFLNITNLKDKYPNQLSGGQKQLVAIARSLVIEPQILLMDEPLSNLDIFHKKNIIELLLKIKKQLKLTIIYVTHNFSEAFKLADFIAILNKGNLEDFDTKENIKNSQNDFTKLFLEL